MVAMQEHQPRTGDYIRAGISATIFPLIVNTYVYLFGTMTIDRPMMMAFDPEALQPLPYSAVLMASIAASVVATALMTVLMQRLAERAFNVFFPISIGVVVVSFIPIYLLHVDHTAVKTLLVLMHLGTFIPIVMVLKALHSRFY